jgi:serine/threonine protein kinase/beta-lactam-binding protein with PASTA domain
MGRTLSKDEEAHHQQDGRGESRRLLRQDSLVQVYRRICMVKIGMLIADRYEVLEKIGTGGMSVVYKAKDHKLNRFVAIKVLKQEFSDNASFVSKFRVEAQAAAGLMHPNIVNVYDVGDERGMYYIVMELVDGITLKQYIEKKSRLSVKEAISIAIQVSLGLEAAHHNHIIHRDIKPQNIIISRDGKVKVTDFGIAKAATSNTITSNVMGSVHYTSPEQARGGYSDERSDIYSLGITIFEMLTGRVPFNGETTVAIAIKHIQEPMPSPRQFVPDIPRSVEQIVLKCCEKSPDRRYQNMEELIADLKQSLIHPDDDFVKVIHPDEESATRLATGSERDDIRRHIYGESAVQGDNGQQRYDGEISRDRGAGRRRDDYTEEEPQAPRYEDGYREEYPEDDYRRDRGRRAGAGRLDAPLRKNRDERARYEDDYGNDFDDDGGYDPGKERIVTILSILAATIIGIVIIVVAAFKLGLVGGGSGSLDASDAQTAQSVTMPDVIGIDADKAKTQLESLGLTVETTYAESDDYDAGKVVGSNVTPGTAVSSGTSVVLTVSAGKNGISVPDVTGKTMAEAVSTLQEKGFNVSKERDYSDDVDKDSVISQDPAGGESAPSGSTVTITISDGPDTEGKVQVPAVTGISREDAMAKLTEAGLTMGNVTESDNTDASMSGLVTSQSVKAGTYVDKGTSVDLEVAANAKSTTTYSFNGEIDAPTADEAPDYTSGTPVYLVIISSDGQKLLDTTTTSFPYPAAFTGITASSGTLSMSYASTASDAVNGQKVITRTLTFTPEN